MLENLLEKYGAEIVTTGKRWRNGKETDEECTIIWVHEKLSKEAVIERGLAFAPSNYDVQVFSFDKFEPIDISEANVERAALQVYGEKHRPVVGGVGISIEARNNPNQYFVGTLGLIAYKKDTGETVGLTNAHVANPENLEEPKGIVASQPAIPDITVGGQKHTFAIARTAELSAFYDAATVEFLEGIEVLPNIQAIIGETQAATASVEVGDIIIMHGRNGFSRGVVISNQMQIKHPIYGTVFTNDIMIEGIDGDFSSGGSSGGIGYLEGTKQTVFLTWGGVTTAPDKDGNIRRLSVGHRVQSVLDNMNLSLTKPKIIDKPDASEPTTTNIDYQTKAVEKLIENYGVKEVKGNSHNPTIVGIINIACNELNLPLSLAKSDETAWCSLAAIYSAIEAERVKDVSRYKQMLVNQGINATARSWEKLDTGLTLDDAKFGDLVVFKRLGSTWQGHVGFYAGNDNENVIVLGGNQSNSINFAKYKSSQLTAVIRLEDALVKYGTKDNRNEKMV